jgi:hypothetical protein
MISAAASSCCSSLAHMPDARQRGTDQHRIDQLTRSADQLLRRTADQLGQDHAGVAAGAQQRRPGDRAHNLFPADLVERVTLGSLEQAIQFLQHGPQREHHVVARVAIGDREDVQIVDLLAPFLQRDKARLHERAEA